MSKALLVFPNQLFKHHPGYDGKMPILLVEHDRFFRDFLFHKKKLILHRASMKNYAKDFQKVHYLERCSTKALAAFCKKKKFKTLVVAELDDHTLLSELEKAKLHLEIVDTPAFLNTSEELKDYFQGKKSFFFTSFYIQMRKRHEILLQRGKPIGGKWSYDVENRKKLPKEIKIPNPPSFRYGDVLKEAEAYVEKHFRNNLGKTDNFSFPITHAQAKTLLKSFLAKRLVSFGPYEDAIAKEKSVLFHSTLSAPLNCGLITPQEIVKETLKYAKTHKVPLQSLEGFLRQVIGWREFIRGIYLFHGKKESRGNFFKHKKKIPASFWSATTGIEPIDNAIEKATHHAYLHHIERLMVIGNFMLLCEFDPKEVYRWFMEFFIDAYDWVMVPNVFGMSQFADGGLFTTKPYFSSSNYILKMSNYKKGPWCEIWDEMFWDFLKKHKAYFKKNPRLAYLLKKKGGVKS